MKRNSSQFKIFFLAILFSSFLGVAQVSKAAVIFEDNFDNQADWWPTCLVCGRNNDGYNGGANSTPTGWTYWRNDEYWNQYAISGWWGPYTAATPNTQPTIQISDKERYGATGKSFIVYNESESDSPNGGGSGWASDGDLTALLPQDYPELYFQFKIKYQNNFKRYWPVNESAAIKTARFMHWDGVGSPFKFFETGNSVPIYVVAISQNAYGAAMASDSARCDPQQQDSVNYGGISYRLPYRSGTPIIGGSPPPASPWVTTTYSATYPSWDSSTWYTSTNYWCNQMGTLPVTKSYFVNSGACTQINGWDTGATNTSTQALGIWDTNWHTITMHGKLNSAPGVNDGIYELYYDGCLVKQLTNMGWIGINGDINAGWNIVTIGGNVFNNYMQITNAVYQDGAEQWYAIDDIVVSTTPIPDDYIIDADIIPPAAPSGLSVS